MTKNEYMFAVKQVYNWKVSKQIQTVTAIKRAPPRANKLSVEEKQRHKAICIEYGMTSTMARQ